MVTATAKEFCTTPRVTADTVQIRVYQTPEVNAGIDIDSVAYGEKTTIGKDADVTGGIEPYTYLWSGNGVGSDNSRLTIASERLYNSTTVTLTATDSVGCSAKDDVKITVVGGPFRISLDKPYDFEMDKFTDVVCLNDSVRLRVKPEGGSGSYKISWQQIEPTVSNVLDTLPDYIFRASHTAKYLVTVVNLTGGVATKADTLTGTVSLTVNMPPAAGIIGTPDTTMCSDTAYTLYLNGYWGDKIAWEYSYDSLIWNGLKNNVDSVRIASGSAQSRQTTYYRASVSNGVCPPVYADNLKVLVYEDLENNIDYQGPVQPLCPEVTDVKFSGNVVSEGGNGVYEYKWQWSKTNNGKYLACPADSGKNVYTWPGRIDSSRYVRRVVFSDGCPFFSPSIKVSVYDDSHIGEIDGENYVCIDSVGYLSVPNASMESYRWEVATDTAEASADWTVISGATNFNYQTKKMDPYSQSLIQTLTPRM